MEFYDRVNEMGRLDSALGKPDATLITLYGRRRVGKTRLLLEWIRGNGGIYWVADNSSAAIHRQLFAKTLRQHFPQFPRSAFDTWQELLEALAFHAKHSEFKGPIILDEFPYMVQAAKELPSILQNFVDHEAKDAQITLLICGSSQSMMQDITLNPAAPLYGRSHQIFPIQPLPISYLEEALKLNSALETLQAYTLWGGVPRYWEYAESFKSNILEAATNLILDPLGPLHNEPNRILAQEVPSATSLRPILDAIGLGAHRVSEIAARLATSAPSLSSYITRLIELNLIARETPFGAPEVNSKKTLYKIKDPFFRFWFNTVAPNKSLLSQANPATFKKVLDDAFPNLMSQAFEELARLATPHISSLNEEMQWLPPKRFWHKNAPEFDLVTLSADKRHLLIGEAKCLESIPDAATLTYLTKDLLTRFTQALRTQSFPQSKISSDITIHYALFVPQLPETLPTLPPNTHLIDAASIISSLK